MFILNEWESGYEEKNVYYSDALFLLFGNIFAKLFTQLQKLCTMPSRSRSSSISMRSVCVSLALNRLLARLIWLNSTLNFIKLFRLFQATQPQMAMQIVIFHYIWPLYHRHYFFYYCSRFLSRMPCARLCSCFVARICLRRRVCSLLKDRNWLYSLA